MVITCKQNGHILNNKITHLARVHQNLYIFLHRNHIWSKPKMKLVSVLPFPTLHGSVISSKGSLPKTRFCPSNMACDFFYEFETLAWISVFVMRWRFDSSVSSSRACSAYPFGLFSPLNETLLPSNKCPPTPPFRTNVSSLNQRVTFWSHVLF